MVFCIDIENYVIFVAIFVFYIAAIVLLLGDRIDVIGIRDSTGNRICEFPIIQVIPCVGDFPHIIGGCNDFQISRFTGGDSYIFVTVLICSGCISMQVIFYDDFKISFPGVSIWIFHFKLVSMAVCNGINCIRRLIVPVYGIIFYIPTIGEVFSFICGNDGV